MVWPTLGSRTAKEQNSMPLYVPSLVNMTDCISERLSKVKG